MPTNNKIMVVEDPPFFLKELNHRLSGEPELTVVTESVNSHQALVMLNKVRPDVVVIDITRGEIDGLKLVKDILHQAPRVKTIVISKHDETFHAERALVAGALGYYMKESGVEVLVEAVKTVSAGKIWLCPELEGKVKVASHSFSQAASVCRLSGREFQIFKLMGKGFGTAAIATKLNLSGKTVGSHKENMKVKLGCTTTQDIRRLAIEWQASQPGS